MHPTKIENFDTKKVEQILLKENKFISELFSVLSLPERTDETEAEQIIENGTINGNEEEKKKFKKATRAESFTELKERVQAKTKITSVEKAKKILAKKAAKKARREEERKQSKKAKRGKKKAQQKKVRAEQSLANKNQTEEETQNNTNMVFSKIDFSGMGKSSSKAIRQEKDPKKILQSLEKQKRKLSDLRESGEAHKAVQIKEKIAWKNALAKAQGTKIKDDPLLLKKTIQKDEAKKRASKRKWEQRQEGVEKAKEERQRKRTENIKKRKTEKKTNKLKKASKKGRIIPGL